MPLSTTKSCGLWKTNPKEYHRQWRASHPGYYRGRQTPEYKRQRYLARRVEILEAAKEKWKSMSDAELEKRRAYQRQWKEGNPDKCRKYREYSREKYQSWREKHPTKSALRESERLNRIRNAPEKVHQRLLKRMRKKRYYQRHPEKKREERKRWKLRKKMRLAARLSRRLMLMDKDCDHTLEQASIIMSKINAVSQIQNI